MAVALNSELDPVFVKALGYLHSKSKDSAERLKALLDESLCRGSDSSYRLQQKDVEPTKISMIKVITSKAESKVSSVLPSVSSTGKPSTTEKVKKEAEKRSADKMKVEPPEAVEIQKKPRLEKTEARSSPIHLQTSKDLTLPDISILDETSADDFAMEMGLACVVCRQMTVLSGNQLVECQECHNLYHQDCHKPQVTDKDVNDPRLVWYCARCTRQMKRMAQKNQKPSQKPTPSVVSTAPVVKDPLVKKTELKPKQESTSSFLAFKRTEVKPSAAILGASSNASLSSSSSAASGLIGWAAFGAKTSSAGPAAGKLGATMPSTNGKPPTASAAQKPVGLSGLVTSKVTLGPKTSSNNSNANALTLKPMPPLTLGKTSLSRSASSDSVSKVGTPSPSSTGSSSINQANTGNGGSSVAGNLSSASSKVTVDPGNLSSSLKVPTSQESQLHAMKRLQMVKKKAAQKKLKK